MKVVVAQLSDWSLPTQRSVVQIQSSANFYVEDVMLLTVEKTKIKKREVGSCPFL